MQSPRQELYICFSNWRKLAFSKIFETKIDPTLSQTTNYRHHSTLHSQVVKELISLQPPLKQVMETEFFSVPPLDLYLVKNRNSRSKAREVVAVWATRSMYKGHLLALDIFPVQSTEKRCKCLRRNSVSVPLSLLLVAKCCGSLPEAL